MRLERCLPYTSVLSSPLVVVWDSVYSGRRRQPFPLACVTKGVRVQTVIRVRTKVRIEFQEEESEERKYDLFFLPCSFCHVGL